MNEIWSSFAVLSRSCGGLPVAVVPWQKSQSLRQSGVWQLSQPWPEAPPPRSAPWQPEVAWIPSDNYFHGEPYPLNTRVALKLMQEASAEVIARGYTHFLTDVFVDDEHSPLRFHTRVLGFERIATHRFGELACDSLRVVLILDIARAYHRLRDRRNRVFRLLGQGVDPGQRLAAAAAS